MKETTIMKRFFENQYHKQYGLSKPKITCVKDGIYIHGGAEISPLQYDGGINVSKNGKGLKIFVNVVDYMRDRALAIKGVEQSDDRIIHILEEGKSDLA